MNDGSEGPDGATRQHMRQSKAEERASIIELYRRLRALTPHAFGTGALIAANVAVFGVMVASGVHPLSPTSQSLLTWGADYAPKVSEGQWWRLLTAMFLHVGVVHIAMNMWGLWNVGSFVERALGTTIFLVIYMLSGWAGSVVSVLMKPMSVSAGASGAIFGIFGAMLALVLRPRRGVPMEALRPIRNSTLSLLAINLWLGITTPVIDLAAHGGGFVAGFLLGAALGHELTPEARRSALRRTVLIGTATFLALAGATFALKNRPVPDIRATLMQFQAVEARVVAAYNSASEKAVKGEISDPQFADILEHDVLPPWRTLRLEPTAMRYVPRELKETVRDLQEYREVREQGWELMARGLRGRDGRLIEQGSERLKRADGMVEEMNGKGK